MEPLPESDEALDEYLEDDDSDLREVLTSMATEARKIVPSCVGLSLALVRDDVTFTLVATDAEIAAIGAAPHPEGRRRLETAPRADLLDQDPSDICDENRWTAFARATAAPGIRSSLSLPLLKGSEVIGGINLYAADAGAFSGKQASLAGALGASAEGAVGDADLGFETRELARRTPRVMSDIRTVEVAVALLAARHHTDVTEARSRLDLTAARAGVTSVQAAVVVIESHQA